MVGTVAVAAEAVLVALVVTVGGLVVEVCAARDLSLFTVVVATLVVVAAGIEVPTLIVLGRLVPVVALPQILAARAASAAATAATNRSEV